MATLYNLDKSDDGTIKLWSSLMVSEVYRYDYKNLKGSKPMDNICKNDFVVYILYKRGITEKDTIYVGKSKNGLKYRPTAHEDKSPDWDYCYVLTESGSLLNDGSIHYIEDQVTKRARKTNRFTVTTNQTTEGTINDREKRLVDPLLEKLVEMLDILGLDLITAETEVKAVTSPAQQNFPSDNIEGKSLKYHVIFKEDKVVDRKAEGYFYFDKNSFVLLKGSQMAPIDTYMEQCKKHGAYSRYIRAINEGLVSKDGLVLQDITFTGPSTPSCWYAGGYGHDYNSCVTDDGRTLYKVRNDLGLGQKSNIISVDKPQELGITSDNVDGKALKYHVTLVGKGFEKVRHAEGTYDFATNTFILFAGAELCPPELYTDSYIGSYGRNGGKPLGAYIAYRRAVENGDIVNDVTVRNLKFNGPSTPCSWYMGRSMNGYTSCTTDDGRTLAQIREDLGISVISRNKW